MKKAFIVGVLLLLASPVFCQTAETFNLSSDLNQGLNKSLSGGNPLKSSMNIGSVPFLPGIYLSRKQATYVTFGILINNDMPQSPDPADVLQTAVLLKTAILVRRNKTNVVLFFDYFKNGSWGLSCRLKF